MDTESQLQLDIEMKLAKTAEAVLLIYLHITDILPNMSVK